MINWQPIETAPKDKDILLFIDGVVIEGRYTKSDKKWEVAHLPSHGCDCCGNENEEPTHWAEINLPWKPGK